MKLTYTHKLILVVAVFVLLAVAVVALLIWPQISAISTLDERLEDADIQILQAQTLLAQRQSIKARSAETEAKRMRLANQMPESPELPSLIVELQDTVNAAGLEFASLTPQQPVAQEAGYSEIGMSLVVRGTWADTVDLLQRMPRLTRQIRIFGFSTSQYFPDVGEDEEPDEQTYVETLVNIRVYTMPANVAPQGAPPAPEDAAQTQ